MLRLTERRLRSMIRKLLREYSLDDRAYSSKGLGIHLSQLDSLIRDTIKKHGIKYPDSYDKTKMNPWKPTIRDANWPGFSRDEMQKMINGIIDIYWLSGSDTGESARSMQNKFTFADNIESLGKTCRDQVENVIFEWLTGKNVSKSTSRFQAQPRWDSNAPPEYKLDILGYDYDAHTLRSVGFFYRNGQPAKVSFKDWSAASSSPKKSVEILQKRLEKVLADNQQYISQYRNRAKSGEINDMYDIDQAFNTEEGEPVVLSNVNKGDGNYVGREFFKDDETFQDFGDYLQEEFNGKYEDLKAKAKEAGRDENNAHKFALEGAKEYIRDYAESLGLTKVKPEFWDK